MCTWAGPHPAANESVLAPWQTANDSCWAPSTWGSQLSPQRSNQSEFPKEPDLCIHCCCLWAIWSTDPGVRLKGPGTVCQAESSGPGGARTCCSSGFQQPQVPSLPGSLTLAAETTSASISPPSVHCAIFIVLSLSPLYHLPKE